MITQVEKIKSDRDWLTTIHTQMAFFLDGGKIICKDTNNNYTFIQVDSTEGFNIHMPIETEFVKEIQLLSEEETSTLTKLDSLQKEFDSLVDIVSLINGTLVFKHKEHNSYYQLSLADFETMFDISNSTVLSEKILSYQSPRGFNSPYFIHLVNDEIIVY